MFMVFSNICDSNTVDSISYAMAYSFEYKKKTLYILLCHYIAIILTLHSGFI